MDAEPPSVPHDENLNPINLTCTASSVPLIPIADKRYTSILHYKENPINLPSTFFLYFKNSGRIQCCVPSNDKSVSKGRC